MNYPGTRVLTYDQLQIALAATLQAVNADLANTHDTVGITVELVTGTQVINRLLQRFMHEAKPRRLDVDWEDVFHKRVKGQKAWMIQILQSSRTGALSCGRVEIRKGYVSIDYLEKRPTFNHPRGLSTQVAFRFAKTLATILEIEQVRLNDPLPDLVSYYEKSLGLARHTVRSKVQYLFTNLPKP
jgi:hypothetical protein